MSPRSGRQRKRIDVFSRLGYRPLRGLESFFALCTWGCARKASLTPGFMLAPASQVQSSNVPFVEFNFVRIQERDELVSERDSLMVLLLTGEVTLHLLQIRLTHGKARVTALPGEIRQGWKYIVHPSTSSCL